jgi:hypothetical protein
LIVYKGSTDTEDVLLNLAGGLAFIVAFVPTKRPDGPGCGLISQPTGVIHNAIRNNVGAVIVALVVAAVITVFVYFVDKQSREDTSLWGNRLRVFSVIVVALFIGAFFVFSKQFEAWGHWVAAAMLFAIIIAVVFINAYLVDKQDEQDSEIKARFYRRYRSIAWMMVGSLIGAGIIALVRWFWGLHAKSWDIPLFALETALILEFAVFWAFHTVELWNHADRNELMTPARQATLPPL